MRSPPSPLLDARVDRDLTSGVVDGATDHLAFENRPVGAKPGDDGLDLFLRLALEDATGLSNLRVQLGAVRARHHLFAEAAADFQPGQPQLLLRLRDLLGE